MMKVDTKLNYHNNLIDIDHAIAIMYDLDFHGDDLENEYEDILRSLEKFQDKVIAVVRQQNKKNLKHG